MSTSSKTDFYKWIQQTAIAIRAKDTNNMDWERLLEVVEDMGANEKRALRSYVKRLIEHCLKLTYWESERERNHRGWKKEIVNFRDEINEILEESPSLKKYLQENYEDWFQKSVKAMSEEFDIPDNNFIQIETILNDRYFGSLH